MGRLHRPYEKILLYGSAGATHYAFTGEMYDPLTGLVYLRARYYAPRQGRFLSKDAWEGDALQPMSYNKWVYGYGNPVLYTDPSGNTPLAAVLASVLPSFVGLGAGMVTVKWTQKTGHKNSKAKGYPPRP